MKQFLLSICLLFSTVAMTGCTVDDDNDDLYDTLIGRVWVGDLGFFQDGRVPLNSSVYFGADGFGTDDLRFASNNAFLDTLKIQWECNDNNDTIWINYGNADMPRELRRAYIQNLTLIGDLYIDGRYYQRVELRME